MSASSAMPDWRVEKIRPQGVPQPEEWHPTGSGSFNNVGHQTWSSSRVAWCKATISPKPAAPPPVSYDEVVQGLSQVVRTYELPGRMRLEDVVEVFNDIWECEQGF
ncbi:hypothetical protein TL16_g06689 [Triparma laevis f. inornata]|uniref:Uncharacterized protein n=1 Tax=Triparma laevis f. inornata TaxID=1714386 RepID=A0A9W7EBG0_9STRA|nr:hypothetical protein TL16_g06689 [Triparma laevis f. inornata]